MALTRYRTSTLSRRSRPALAALAATLLLALAGPSGAQSDEWELHHRLLAPAEFLYWTQSITALDTHVLGDTPLLGNPREFSWKYAVAPGCMGFQRGWGLGPQYDFDKPGRGPKSTSSEEITHGAPAAAAEDGPIQLSVAVLPREGAAAISFERATAGPASVVVFDATGRPMCTLADGDVAAGPQELTWDGRDDGGLNVAGGVYIVRFAAGDDVLVRKLIHIR